MGVATLPLFHSSVLLQYHYLTRLTLFAPSVREGRGQFLCFMGEGVFTQDLAVPPTRFFPQVLRRLTHAYFNMTILRRDDMSSVSNW